MNKVFSIYQKARVGRGQDERVGTSKLFDIEMKDRKRNKCRI